MPGLTESTYPQGPVLVDGYYPATLKEVTEYTKTYDGKETDRLAWVFDVQADEDAVDDAIDIEDEDYEYDGTFEVAAHTGVNKSKKPNSNWYKLAMDTIVPEGCKNTDELIGTKCIVNVSSFVSSDGITKNTVEKIRPAKKGKAKAAARAENASAKKKAEEAEADFDADMDDLPF